LRVYCACADRNWKCLTPLHSHSDQFLCPAVTIHFHLHWIHVQMCDHSN
jgi:hypothetical protein